jgi:ATP-dependent Lon protease
VSEILKLPRCEIDASIGGVGFSVAGVERGWSSAQPGRPLETILQHRVGNPLVVIDETCKAQTATSEKGTKHSFADTLLNLLEPATSFAWECSNLRIKFDMSHISWIVTANDVSRVPEPLVNRYSVINFPEITCEQLQGFARIQARRMGLTQTSVEVIAEVIERTMQNGAARISLRNVVRMLRRAETLASRHTQH